MAIDYMIDLACTPKAALTSEGISERLKNKARADEVALFYQQHGEGARPPDRMGFDFTRTTPQGEETYTVLLEDILDEAAELDAYAPYCVGCPANAAHRPFGCFNQIHYPISSLGEKWLLDQLPGIEQPLVWLLLKQGVLELGYDGESVAPLRSNPVYFEERALRGRDMIEFVINANQVFEMLFLTGTIQPAHAGVVLLFFNAIPRELEAAQIVTIMKRSTTGGRALTPEEIAAEYPLHHSAHYDDDATVGQFKAFLAALYRAWSLDVPMLLDV